MYIVIYMCTHYICNYNMKKVIYNQVIGISPGKCTGIATEKTCDGQMLIPRVPLVNARQPVSMILRQIGISQYSKMN